MSIYKRKDSPYWYTKFEFLGRKIDCSTATMDQRAAEEVEHSIRERIHREEKIGDSGTLQFAEVAARWLKSTKKKSDESRLDWFLYQPGLPETPIGEITLRIVGELKQSLVDGVPGRVLRVRKNGTAYGKPRGQLTVDRHLNVLRAILNYAVKSGLLTTAPFVEKFNAEGGLPDWLTQEEFMLLHAELPRHLQIAARFAVSTGMRETSMLKLTWDRVDLKRRHAWAPGEMMKGGDPFGFPLNDMALAALADARLYAPTGNHVFQYNDPMLAGLTDLQMRATARELVSKTGKVSHLDLRRALRDRYGRVGRTERRQEICRDVMAEIHARGKVVRTDSRARVNDTPTAAFRSYKTCYTDAFIKAVERARIVGKHVTWHTLRHSWASWLIQAGATPRDLMELGNWKTEAMMRNYAHLASGNLAVAAGRIPLIEFTPYTATANRLERV